MNERIRPTLESPRGSFAARVVRNVRICTDHYRLTLGVKDFPKSEPGQFVQIECRGEETRNAKRETRNDGEETMWNEEVGEGYRGFEWGAAGTGRPRLSDADFVTGVAYLRRPFSIAGRREGRSGHWSVDSGQNVEGGDTGVEIDVIHRVVGRGTSWLEGLRAGDRVSVLGPMGKGFWMPAEMELALLVGGGVGIPPMFYMAEALARAGKRAVGLVGAQRRDLVPVRMMAGSAEASAEGEPVMNAAEFGEYGYETVVATDDGSMGMKGFVTAALRRHLEALRHKGIEAQRVVVYCCGPTAMMKATAKVCGEFGVMCQVSLEQPMACGMGTCQSCVVKWRGGERLPQRHRGTEDAQRRPELRGEKLEERREKSEGGMEETRNALPSKDETRNGGEWVYKLTCTEGPVFDSRELMW